MRDSLCEEREDVKATCTPTPTQEGTPAAHLQCLSRLGALQGLCARGAGGVGNVDRGCGGCKRGRGDDRVGREVGVWHCLQACRALHACMLERAQCAMQ